MGNPCILLDFKQYRIRIHKEVCRSLNNPPYVQLLINPTDMLIAIVGLDHELRGNQTFKITRQLNSPNDSVEINSKSFFSQLKELSSELSDGHSYRMTGKIIQEKRIAVFPFTTLTCIDK